MTTGSNSAKAAQFFEGGIFSLKNIFSASFYILIAHTKCKLSIWLL
jgi:hypothetical protein